MSGVRARWLPFLLVFLASAAIASITHSALAAEPDAAVVDDASLIEGARLRSLALADMEDGNFGRAIEHLERLAEILPGNLLPPANLAICYFRLGRIDDALAALERAGEIDPDNPSRLYTAATVLREAGGELAAVREVLERFARAHPGDPRPHFLAARIAEDAGERERAATALRRALDREPENVVLLGDLAVAAAKAGNLEGVTDAVNGLEDRFDGFEGPLADAADRVRERIWEGKAEAVEPAAMGLRNVLRPTGLYQAHLVPLTGGRGGALDLFPQLDFVPPLPKRIQGGEDIEVRFVIDDPNPLARRAATPLAIASSFPDRREDLLVVAADGPTLLRFDGREPTPLGVTFPELPRDPAVTIRDLDQDETNDLLAWSADLGILLWPGGGEGFGPPVALAEPSDLVTGVALLDVDHDGDLDLLVTRRDAPDRYFENAGSGGFRERANALGIGGGEATTTGAALADLDDDGDLDLLTVGPEVGLRVWDNRRSARLEEVGGERVPEGTGRGATSLLVEDFDGDGAFDVLLWGPEGARLLANDGEGRLVFRDLPEPLETSWRAATSADVDNDGDRDVVAVVGEAGSLLLVRNRAGELRPEARGVELGDATGLDVADLDDDGDLDLVVHRGDGPGAILWNEGGSKNHWLRLALRGNNTNNAKNNTQGTFARIETRVGDEVRTVLGSGGINHLGLGARRQADVVRVVWTNGLAQSWQLVAADATLVEEQVLKGSCPFLYAWNGEEFAFVTDLMWKSPLGMVLADGSPAPHQSARDFVLVPGEILRPVDGELWLQVTEELWEAAYVDRQRLLAVDHPPGTRVLVDERFLPPPHPTEAPLHVVGDLRRPVAARDHRGRDVLSKIAARDGLRVDDLPLDRYQGLTEGHSLELVFDDVPAGRRLRLVLWGWTFPTDTSINVALSQDPGRELVPPSLEVSRPDGTWETAIPFLGFPNGKRKAMVVDVTGLLPVGRATVRIPTSMQIYWDAAALAVGDDVPARVTTLAPGEADLHPRGFSRLVRSSPTAPHLFDYDRVTVEPRFRDMTGRFTRFGDVAELLTGSDSRSVVMNAGDELTVVYDAANLPPLPDGWQRDWVLATDGWVKDADVNTVASQTVGPLPYHGMTSYPDSPEHRFPDTPEHREYLERYQTREVGDGPFRRALSDLGRDRDGHRRSADEKEPARDDDQDQDQEPSTGGSRQHEP